MPEQRRSIRSHQAIIDAAAELIRSHGVPGTAVAEIIARSGTSAGAVYHHFSGKQAIVVAVAHQVLQWPLSAMEDYADNPAPPAALFGYAVEAMRYEPELAELLVQLGAGALTDDSLGCQLQSEFSQLRDHLDQTLHRWAEINSIPRESLTGVGQMLVGLTLGYATQRALVEDFDTDAYLALGQRMLTSAVGTS